MKKTILIIFTIFITISLNSFANAELLLKDELKTINVFNQTANSTVNITNYQRVKRGGGFFFNDIDDTEVPVGSGSGYIWNKDGYIVTNYHVVHKGVKFFVTFKKNSKQFRATLVGAVPEKDIAVLKLVQKPTNLFPIHIGSSINLKVGQNALAIGNPFGLDHTMTKGIVSALNRKIPGFGGVKIYGMIQTDCSINPGNSGGPLLNSSGELIGMNTMIFSKSGSSSGIGFAVPVDTIKKIVPLLIKNGKVERPALGISLLGEKIKNYLNIKKGIVIGDLIDPYGPAARSGLKGIKKDRYGRYYLGDIILSIGGISVNNYDDIYHVLDKYTIGDKVKITYLRDKNIKTVVIRLSKLKNNF